MWGIKHNYDDANGLDGIAGMPGLFGLFGLNGLDGGYIIREIC